MLSDGGRADRLLHDGARRPLPLEARPLHSALSIGGIQQVVGHALALLQRWAFISTGTVWAPYDARRADSMENRQDLLVWQVDLFQGPDAAALLA